MFLSGLTWVFSKAMLFGDHIRGPGPTLGTTCLKKLLNFLNTLLNTFFGLNKVNPLGIKFGELSLRYLFLMGLYFNLEAVLMRFGVVVVHY
jgi:hypothetical protein